MNELKSYTEYAVSTPTADFVIGFDFNYGEDAVNVTVDDVPANEAGYSVVYLNETTVRLSPSVPSGVVRLQRETDIDQTDHAYRAGAKFIAQTMDENFEQLRHSQQEVRDGFSKLASDTYEVIEVLDETLGLAQDAAQNAQDAAVIAQNASDAVHAIIVDGKVSTSSVSDESGRTQQELNNTNLHAISFFTSSEYSAWVASPKTFDATRPLQEFLKYIAEHNVGRASMDGVFAISAGLTIGTANNTHATPYLSAKTTLIALNAIDTMVLNKAGARFNLDCDFVLKAYTTRVAGDSGYYFGNKTCRLGYATSGDTKRQKVGNIYGEFFYQNAVLINDLSNLASYCNISGVGCGSGCPTRDGVYRLTANYSAITRTGSSGSLLQRSTLTVDILPPNNLTTTKFIVIGGQPCWIESISGNTLTVYPWIDTTTASTGQLYYVFGGVVDVIGADASCVTFEQVESLDSAINTNHRAKYGFTVKQHTTQSSEFAVMYGDAPNSTTMGGIIADMYTESTNAFNIANLTVFNTYTSLQVLNTQELQLNKCTSITPKTTANNLTAQSGMINKSIVVKGRRLEYEDAPNNNYDSSSVRTVDLLSENKYMRVFRNNTQVIEFTRTTPTVNNLLFGIQSGIIVVQGTQGGTQYKPTSVTFRVSSGADYTVNGGTADVVFNNFACSAVFSIHFNASTKNYTVALISQKYSDVNIASGLNWSIGTVAAGTVATSVKTIATASAKVGNIVRLSFDKPLSGLILYGEVPQDGQVIIRAYNPTTASISPEVGNLRIVLMDN